MNAESVNGKSAVPQKFAERINTGENHPQSVSQIFDERINTDKNTLCKNLPKIQLHRIDQTTNAILYDGEFTGEIVFEQGEYCVRVWYELRYPSAVFEVNEHSARIESPLRNFREVGRCRTMEEAVKLAQAYISTTSGETDET